MHITQIVACDLNGCIGKDGDLPWHIPEDLKKFKRLTTNSVVIMGRKTLESIGKALPNRINIVITRNENYEYDDVIVVDSLEAAVTAARDYDKNCFIIGGAEIYKLSADITDDIIITRVNTEVIDGDAYYNIDENIFKRSKMCPENSRDYNSKISWHYEVWTRKTKVKPWYSGSNLIDKFLFSGD